MTTSVKTDAGWDALASDGSVVRIRPLRDDDEPPLDAMNQRVSDRSIYLRFFGVSRRLADDHTHHLGRARRACRFGGRVRRSTGRRGEL